MANVPNPKPTPPDKGNPRSEQPKQNLIFSPKPKEVREESPEYLFTQALESMTPVQPKSLQEMNGYALASIAYSLLGLTKQLDYIRMELEWNRTKNDA